MSELSSTAAYAELAEATPPWHDRVAVWLLDHVWHPLRSRWQRPGAGLAGILAPAAAREAELQALDDATWAAETSRCRALLRRHGLAEAAVAPTLALLRETARRTLGQRPYDVQLMGAWALLQGRLAEMATGEGKSLTAALAVACAALARKPAHLVTVNDYLATRDAQALAPFYAALGLRVGTVVQGQDPDARRAAYRCDITYCSNKEFAFDYLKDRVTLACGGGRLPMAVAALAGARPAPLLLRGLHFVIVDEADSVFVDEARTPLILSAHVDDADQRALGQRCGVALALAAQMVAELHYRLYPAERRVWLTPAGEAALAELAPALAGEAPDAVWASARGRREQVLQALSATLLYQRDQHYLVAEGKVVIVDEATGRVMPDRSWEAGLHQMIEAKEGVELTPRRVTLARITYQRLFRRCLLLAGMTGTGHEVAGELWQVYRLRTVAIPLHRPSRRAMRPPRLLADAGAKWAAVVAVVREEALGRGRPVLIGTRSVEASEQLSRVLGAAGLAHALLNARQDADEAALIAEAGQPARVTVATNMAGRGTDIRLGEGVAAAGGLHVILTECHASARIDRQLFGRGARQGDAGSAEMIIAADDELLRTEAPWALAWLRARWGDAAPAWAVHTLCRIAQGRAGWRDARQRRATLRLDERLDRMLAFTGTAE
jgi:preprotein translocase subunit SecA